MSGVWSTGQSMSISKSDYGATVANGKFYALGGRSGDGYFTPLNNVVVYEPSADAWTTGVPLPTERVGLCCVTIHDKIHCLGGEIQYNQTLNHDVFDIISGQWSSAAPMPEIITNPACVAIEDNIYMVGGTNSNFDYLDTVYIYHASTDTWTQGQKMPENKSGIAICAVGKKIYCIGGSIPYELSFSVLIYDTEADSWTRGSDLSVYTSRNDCCLVKDNKIYMFVAGERKIFVYSPNQDSWEEFDSMPYFDYSQMYGLVDNKAYVFTPNEFPLANITNVYTFPSAAPSLTVLQRYVTQQGTELKPEEYFVLSEEGYHAAEAPEISDYTCIGCSLDGAATEPGTNFSAVNVNTDATISFVYVPEMSDMKYRAKISINITPHNVG